MRNAFADEVTKLAKDDPRIVFLSGDIGNRLFDGLKEAVPERFFNCGVAEANMISMAAGFASDGFRPIAYTITPFITYRCFEQIRVDLCYHNQPVIFVGVGSGLGYATLGATHHSCEDIAVLRALPNMTILCPGDPLEVRYALRDALNINGPVYIRLGKKGEANIHSKDSFLDYSRPLPISVGSDVCMLATGTILPECLAAAKVLEKSGVSTMLFSFPRVKPLDTKFLEEQFSRFKLIVSVEEHSVIGGFGGALSEWILRCKKPEAELLCLGLPDKFYCEVGEREHALRKFDLTPEIIAEKVRASYQKA